MKSRTRVAAAFVMAVSVMIACPLDAQVRFWLIVVAVTDQTGGAVPGAEVTVTQTETDLTIGERLFTVGLRLRF